MVGSLLFVANLIAPLSLPDSVYMASHFRHVLKKTHSIQGSRFLIPALRGGCGPSAKAAHVTTHDSLPKGTPPHNFGPATQRDNLVYGSFRPGFSETTESAGAVKDEDVAVWAKFMSDQGVKRVVCLLNDDELQFYR
jgi:hypothetical protein